MKEAESRVAINKPVLLRVGDKKIALIRKENDWLAVDNSCPHQHESLAGGQINAQNEIICPLHEYRFNLTTGRECRNRTKDLTTYPVKINEGLYLGFN